jgi:hypothetical protein
MGNINWSRHARSVREEIEENKRMLESGRIPRRADRSARLGKDLRLCESMAAIQKKRA